ncbi:hypothetical protein BGZ99_002939 [Dissophora globulifera]|uniref:Uncharacterized protein n=1 Tax=Dissophora globulifera TaxID=979702 RepID=A0A9P6RNL9_9FUNG|nr:hypothetical protein BGZ99_002939 [Dissophora globulifera]
MPSLDDLRDVPQRILATTNKALGDIGGTIVSIAKPVMSSLPGRKGGPSTPPLPPPPPPPLSTQAVLWVRRNPGKVVLGSVLVSAALVAGSMAFKAGKARREHERRSRILRGGDGARREVVVVTNVATAEGVAMALDMEERGFIVFVAVPDQAKANEVQNWQREHIFSVIVPELTEVGDVQVLVAEVSAYLEEINSGITGSRSVVGSGLSSDNTRSGVSSAHTFASPVFSTSSSFMLVEEDEHLSSSPLPPAIMSTSTGQSIDLDKANAVSEKHTVQLENSVPPRLQSNHVAGPLYRLSAVIINPKDTVMGSIENLEVKAWRRCFDINVTSTIQIAHQFLPLLKSTTALPEPRSRSPRVIVITSAIASSTGLPYQSAVCASHHALVSIADSLRREVQQKGIDVVCLKTGSIRPPSPIKVRNKE